MRAYECDVCGKLYKNYTYKYLVNGRYNHTDTVILDGVANSKFDLCPDCMLKVLKVLKVDIPNEEVKYR